MSDGCPIWGSAFPAISRPSTTEYKTLVDDSPRAGGSFQIDDNVKRMVGQLPNDAKARLTTWVVDQNDQRTWMPEITRETVEDAKRMPALPVYERANRLLWWISTQLPSIGRGITIKEETYAAYARTESTTWEEVCYCVEYLKDCGWVNFITHLGIYTDVLVTVAGYRQTEEQQTNALSAQGFVAMWFDDSMKEAREEGIKQGIIDAGYKPYVVDEDLHIDKIDDRIVAQIRRSRFVVADFTYGRNGARGSVYFEAGLALGRDIPVFFTCRKDKLKKIHFDTRQYPHIVWETPEDLRVGLQNRILAVLGQGPEPIPSI